MVVLARPAGNKMQFFFVRKKKVVALNYSILRLQFQNQMNTDLKWLQFKANVGNKK